MRITAILTFRCISQHHQNEENFYEKRYILHANEISYKITNDVTGCYVICNFTVTG